MRIRSACVCVCVCLVSYWLNVFTLSHNVSLWARAQLSGCVCFPRTNDCGNATHYRRWKRGSKWAFFCTCAGGTRWKVTWPPSSLVGVAFSLRACDWRLCGQGVGFFLGGGQPCKLFTRSNWLAEWRLYWVTSCWPRPPSNMGIHPVLNNSKHVLANNSGDLFKCFQMQWGNEQHKKVAHTASCIIECIIAWPSQLHSYKKKQTKKNPRTLFAGFKKSKLLAECMSPWIFSSLFVLVPACIKALEKQHWLARMLARTLLSLDWVAKISWNA